MAVLGSNTLNHSADLLIQRAGATRITVTSAGITVGGTINASDTVTGPTFNATSTTSGGFQGIAADAVSTPSFTWTSDLTTGIYRATTSDVGITGGGVVRARFGGSILLYKNTFVFPVDDLAADGTTTTRASGTLNWRGKYWNGTSSINTDWNIIYVPTDTLGAGEFRIRNGTTIRLRVNNSGTVTATTFSGALDGNATTATTATNCSRQILSGNGMNFTGGQLNTDRTITLGTPSTITGSTTNSVTTSSHTHALTVNLGVTGGTTAGPIITSSAGTNATIPTASGTASGVVTTGNQTWAGTKTFSSTISGSINGNAATATNATNLNRSVTGGNGLSGGGTLNQDRIINLRTPLSITATSSNDAGDNTTGHTHNVSNSLARDQMAAGSTGAVGMFALMRQTTTNTSRAPGATIAGSNLRYVNLNGNDGGSTVTPAGTWRIHGSNTSGSGDAANSSVWQRIS
jgi:hypothetical protein